MPAPSSSFADFVDGHVPVEKELPFVHTTRCEFLLPLCASGSLSTRDCPVFKEPLIYFFYGRPAYRSRVGDLPNTVMAPMPICLVFKPGIFDGQLKRVFPFDSGAAHVGMFTPHVNPSELLNFVVHPSLASVKKAVNAFFATNGSYYAATAKNVLFGSAGTSGVPAVDSYYSLITQEGTANYDDRRAAIEAQVSAPLTLKDNLLCVVVPTAFLDMRNVRDTIVNTWRAYPLRYNHVRGTAPNQYAGVIAEKLEEFLRNGGYL